ncbi:MAG: hypothetical protein KDJ87_04810 [Rhizobiaceae bacterium]|nr:hypothetical protein [Rhizobiaceae bacterium]
MLTQDLAEFCQSGVSVILAARSARGLAIAGLALACRITSEGRMRILLRGPANGPILAALDADSPIAVTFSEPCTHRSIQVKAPRAARADVEAGDTEEIERQGRSFGEQLIRIGYTPRFADHYRAYRRDEIVALEFLPTDAFVQTPGPGAGEQLA